MTEEHKKSFFYLFSYIFKGNAHASNVAMRVLEFVHAWDDQYDEGKQLSNEVLLSTLTDIGSSPLWTTKMGHHFKLVYIKWMTSNKFEDQKLELEKSWMLRAAVYDIFIMLAEQLYGLAWAEEIAPIVYQAYGESLEDFISEVKNA